MINNTEISRNLANKSIYVTREFNAPVQKVWKAWTESQLLDKWWAPKPWRAETKSMDFKDGGLWLYCMVGPNGEQHWCRVDFEIIHQQQTFTATSAFCDAEGNINDSAPLMHWNTRFKANGDSTTVEATISFDDETAMQAIIEMGFEGGFTMGLGNLDELLLEI